MHPRVLPILVTLVLALSLLGHVQGADASRNLLELRLGQDRVEGIPLAWSKQRVYLLARDGRLWEFPPTAAEDFRKVPGVFTSFSPGVMRSQVQAELGNRYEVTGAGHYLVAHPAGQKNLWADRFEDLYRSFIHYFSVRGFTVKNPEFPLVAIVLPDYAAFRRYAQAEGRNLPSSVLGYYSPLSNRIALYDTTRQGADWRLNAETIIHEATHQSAFNTGIHSRFADQPRWVVEGLAMLFEARGVWDSRNYPSQSERINRSQLEAFRAYASSKRKSDSLLQLISSDRRFDSDTQNAYAEAWALSFFLVETEPRKYAQYLQRLAALPPFAERSSADRVKDFTSVFSGNFALLESRFSRFIRDLR
jgi:hypothetical protein